MKKDVAFLILCNKVSDDVARLYYEISSATREMGNTFLLYHQTDELLPSEIRHLNHYAFDDSVLSQLNYIPIGFRLIPGNNHYPLLKFAADNSDYTYYWLIEEDVRFTGSWKFFFESFGCMRKDLLTSHIRTPVEEPEWYWWHALAHPYQIIPLEKRMRSFNPIYRLSIGALRYIHDALLSFWCGHHEVLLPTLLHRHGFEIMDFGGDGAFVHPGDTNRFYINNSPNRKGILNDGTMRYRPVFQTPGDIENKLYHPVKTVHSVERFGYNFEELV